MKKILRTVSLLLICGTLCLPVAEARGGNGSNTARPSTGQQRPSGRPGNSGARPSQPQPAQRPGNQGGNHGNRPGQNQPSQRPGNQGSNHGNRPGQNQPSQRPGNQGGNHGNRPGQNQPSQRPGNQGGNHSNRPGQSQPDYRPGQPTHRPGQPVANHRPGQPSRPAHGYEHYYRPTPPSRPYLPPPRPYYRPAPPRTWRPAPTWRPFSTVLGVSFGSAINVSLNLLFNSGYTVSSYGPDAIYLSNVPMLNCYWPDATMYYSNGALAGSEFVYYTPYNNATRYNTVFNALCGSYGTPVSVTTNGGLTVASWWGPGNQYISLSYGGQYAGNGSLGYYTTLTFGI